MMRDQITQWNPYNQTFTDNPYTFFKTLRSDDPVHKGVTGDWLVTRHEDVKAVLASKVFHTINVPEVVKNKIELLSNNKDDVDLSSVYEGIHRWLLYLNAPHHTELRRIMYKAWAKLDVEENVNQITFDVVEELKKSSDIDFVKKASTLIPIRTICTVLGVEEIDVERIRAWSYHLSRIPEPFTHLRNLKLANKAAIEFSAFLDEFVRERGKLAETGNDFISIFLKECQGKLNHKEILSALQQIFFAGTETTIVIFGLIMECLVEHPEKWKQLGSEKEQLSTGIDELIRYNPPIHYTIRMAIEDTYIGDQLIKKGERVYVCLASANRDPEVFEHPEELDLERSPNPHLSFGYATHFCLGSKLAKLEILYFCKHLKASGLFFEKNGPAPLDRASVLFRCISTLPLRIVQDSSDK